MGRPEGKRPSGRPRIILKQVFMKWEDMNWIALVQIRDRWRDLLNVVMRASGSIKCGDFLEFIFACKERFCSMQLVTIFHISLACL